MGDIGWLRDLPVRRRRDQQRDEECKGMVWKTEKVNMPFEVKDCTLITRMGGVQAAVSLRELREGVARCPLECLFHHFCETQLRPTFDDPEFSNDFAVWAAKHVRDRILAERLGVINPYEFDNLEQLREVVLEVVDDRLSEVGHHQFAPAGEDFRFMRAVTVVFDVGIQLRTPDDLVTRLPQFSTSSIYYHFVEARRRTETRLDDFSNWLAGFGAGTEPLLDALHGIDFYYLTLRELKDALLEAVCQPFMETAHG